MVDVDIPAGRRNQVSRRDCGCYGRGAGRVSDDLLKRKGNAAWRAASARMHMRNVARVGRQPGQLDGHGERTGALDHRARTGRAAAVLSIHREIDGWRWGRRAGLAAAGSGRKDAKNGKDENLHARLIRDLRDDVAMVEHGPWPL
jgi:hypothetical protein